MSRGSNNKSSPPQQTQEQLNDEIDEIEDQFARSEAAKARRLAREQENG